MKYQTSNPNMNQLGFTIIEVALVLAIAGLIFLVVFLALPALQNSQKDTARKQDVGRVVAALQSYAADHQGTLPSPSDSNVWFWCNPNGSGGSDFCPYVNNIGTEVEGTALTTTTSDGVHADLPGNIDVFVGLLCPNNANAGNATSSDAAVAAKLSNGTTYCADM